MKYSRALEKGCGFHGSRPVKLMLRRVKTHTSIHSRRTAAGLCTSFTPTLHTGILAPLRPPAGPHAGGQQQSVEELPAVAIATASPQRTSTGLALEGGGASTYLPLGASRATDDTCSLPGLWILLSSRPVPSSILQGTWFTPAMGPLPIRAICNANRQLGSPSGPPGLRQG